MLDIHRLDLASQFPSAFFADETQRKPLKIGIHCAIRERLNLDEADAKILKRIMSGYCGSLHYRRACAIEGAVRIDLDGQRAGVVTTAEAEHAKILIRKTLNPPAPPPPPARTGAAPRTRAGPESPPHPSR